MKKALLVSVFLTFISFYSIAQLAVAGTTLGEKTREVEKFLTFKGIEGKYHMKSLNNSSGICSYIQLTPIKSDEELRRLSVDQMTELLLFLQRSFRGDFGDVQELDGVEVLNFETDGCLVQIAIIEDYTTSADLQIQIYHEKAFTQLLREISESGHSIEEWIDKH